MVSRTDSVPFLYEGMLDEGFTVFTLFNAGLEKSYPVPEVVANKEPVVLGRHQPSWDSPHAGIDLCSVLGAVHQGPKLQGTTLLLLLIKTGWGSISMASCTQPIAYAGTLEIVPWFWISGVLPEVLQLFHVASVADLYHGLVIARVNLIRGLAASPSLRMLCFTWLSPVSFWNALPLPHMTVRPRWPRSILQSHWVSPYTDWAYIWSCVVLPTVLLMVGSFLAWWWFASSATMAYVEQHLCGPTVFSRGPACLCTLCLWLRHAARSTQVYDFGWAWTKRYQCTEVGAHIASPEPCHSGSVAF